MSVLSDMKIEFALWDKEGRPPYLSADNHVFFYGSILTAIALKRAGARFQIWLGNEFDYSYFGAHLEDLFNYDFGIIPFGVMKKEYERNQSPSLANKMFFRSNSGYKKLQGGIYSAVTLMEECKRVNLFKEDLIIGADEKHIDAEYRLVIRSRYDEISDLWKNTVVTGSGYEGSGPSMQSIIEKVEADLDTATYHPYPLWILDVVSSGGNIYQLEANSINTSGLYDCDVKLIVEEILKIEKEEIK